MYRIRRPSQEKALEYQQQTIDDLNEFQGSRHYQAFSKCSGAVETGKFGALHIMALKKAFDEQTSATRLKICTPKPEINNKGKKARRTLSYFDPDPDDSSYYKVMGFKFSASETNLFFVERHFPLELVLRDVEDSHISRTAFGINYRGETFNFMTALSITLSNVLSSNADAFTEDEVFPIALPGERGLYMGYAEKIDPDLFAPNKLTVSFLGGGKTQKLANALPYENPEFVIVIDRFISSERLNDNEAEIYKMYNKISTDESPLHAGILEGSRLYFHGGGQREIEVRKLFGYSYDQVEDSINQHEEAKQFIEEMMTSEAWYNFSRRALKHHIPELADDVELNTIIKTEDRPESNIA